MISILWNRRRLLTAALSVIFAAVWIYNVITFIQWLR
jgi:hypothetical protein